ncbi:DJ-1/PfpI family protein [Anoxybacterium hadale]|uniref:DJ-1/PfpI family protein n=1 Tax=Anoxybacterium hadale TaxID=3408580 RepID=UPI003B007557
MPDAALDECGFENADALILPGGDTWTETVHDPVLSRIEQCLEKGTLVAAICGATFGLARKGLLDSRPHTSNDLEYLKMICPNYGGEQYYEQVPAVTDGKLITASVTASLEFSAHVLKALDVFSEKTLDAWYNLYHTQQPNYFNELLNSIQY